MPSAIHFGWFAVIVVPLLQSLKWVHGYVGNWGWSIVILTIIINLVLAPLRHKQVVSMRKMQEIQPEVKAIQDRYSKLKATDPAKQKMNQEMMALYREKKVNPASGCVPVLLTFPIMIAMWARCCRCRSSCAARPGSAGFTTCRRPTRATSCRF